jgi:hypothetical protein
MIATSRIPVEELVPLAERALTSSFGQLVICGGSKRRAWGSAWQPDE